MKTLGKILAYSALVAGFGGIYYIFKYGLDLLFENVTFFYSESHSVMTWVLALFPALFVFLLGLYYINKDSQSRGVY